MTANQIAYQSLQETKRSNLVREKETERSNKAKERETHRHNVASIGLGYDQLSETERANKAKEEQNYLNYVESKTHNIALRSENARHNRVVEQQSQRQLAIGASQANTAAKNAETNSINAETQKKMARIADYDSDTRRAAQEETVRHNKWTDGLGLANTIIGGIADIGGIAAKALIAGAAGGGA